MKIRNTFRLLLLGKSPWDTNRVLILKAFFFSHKRETWNTSIKAECNCHISAELVPVCFQLQLILPPVYQSHTLIHTLLSGPWRGLNNFLWLFQAVWDLRMTMSKSYSINLYEVTSLAKLKLQATYNAKALHLFSLHSKNICYWGSQLVCTHAAYTAAQVQILEVLRCMSHPLSLAWYPVSVISDIHARKKIYKKNIYYCRTVNALPLNIIWPPFKSNFQKKKVGLYCRIRSL